MRGGRINNKLSKQRLFRKEEAETKKRRNASIAKRRKKKNMKMTPSPRKISRNKEKRGKTGSSIRRH